LFVSATINFTPTFVAASTTLSKPATSIVDLPSFQRWKMTSVAPAPSPPYWGKPAGL